MKHDDLCPDKIQQNWATCWTCDVIARVREDEQLRQYEAQSENWVKGYKAGLSAAREAVEFMPAEPSWEAQEERIAALAAIDALQAPPTSTDTPD